MKTAFPAPNVFIAASFASAFLVPPPVFAQQSPAQVVEAFYRWEIHPSRSEIAGRRYAPVRRLLGEAFYRALEAQKAYEATCAKYTPHDIKPYMLDQSPFYAWPDGAKSLRSVAQTVRGDYATVDATLEYDDTRWTDRAILGRERGRWVILDVRWQDGGSVTGSLVAFASERCMPEEAEGRQQTPQAGCGRLARLETPEYHVHVGPHHSFHRSHRLAQRALDPLRLRVVVDRAHP